MYLISIFLIHLFVDLPAKASVLLLFFVIKMTKLAKLKIVRPLQIEHAVAVEHFKFNRRLFKTWILLDNVTMYKSLWIKIIIIITLCNLNPVFETQNCMIFLFFNKIINDAATRPAQFSSGAASDASPRCAAGTQFAVRHVTSRRSQWERRAGDGLVQWDDGCLSGRVFEPAVPRGGSAIFAEP